VPVGAFAVNEKLAASSLVPGDHGTTYGGNPFAAAAVSAVFDLYAAGDICGRAKKAGEILASRLDELKAEFPFIRAHRGRGLMRGAQFDVPIANELVSEGLEAGLVLNHIGDSILRFLPPLVVSIEQVDEMADSLEQLIRALA
jgi:acetylornithine/N-succinyldiaminopimelate aminotransferase